MILLLIFAFFAGIVTLLSPCILPLLPIILSSSVGGANTGKSKPLGVVTGFILSFTFFTLFLSAIVKSIGLPADYLRIFSVVVIALFGISMLIPQFQLLLEKLFSRLSQFVPQNNPAQPQNHLFWSGILIGLSLGLLWTPCVGPILASVIALAVTETVTLNAFLITLAYSIGTAIPMFLIMLGGQNTLKRVPWLLTNSANIQKVFGVIMILTALGIYTGIDRKFQSFVIQKFPQYGSGLTGFEDIAPVRQQLDSLKGTDSAKSDSSQTQAPELIPGGQWFNLPADKQAVGKLTLADLKGKVVLIDFWTYSCINCQRTLPYVKNWWEKYKDKGLVIIGVHSPEFEFEKNPKNVSQAISDFGLKYPVMQDNDFATWKAYDNHYWPAKYLLDKDGVIRYTHFGEGNYDQTEENIQKLLLEAGATGISSKTSNLELPIYANTPETYLGYGRLDNFASPEQVMPDTLSAYSSPKSLPLNAMSYEGNWIISKEFANPKKGAALNLRFDAKEVFLVMNPKQGSSQVKVFVDGSQQFFGVDNKNGIVTVSSDKLYKLINLPAPGQHSLRLEFLDDNTEAFAFTFG